MIHRLGVKSDDAEVDDQGVDSDHTNPRVWLGRLRVGLRLGVESAHANPRVWLGRLRVGLRLSVESAHANPRDHNGRRQVWAEPRRLVSPCRG